MTSKIRFVESTQEQSKVKLHLCSGNNPKDGWINVDIIQRPGVDRLHDLNEKFPWAESTIDEIYINCSLEHLADVDHFMKESHRVLKNGGILHIIVPYYNTGIAPHPYHRHYFNFAWFKFFLIESERKGIYAFDSPDGFSGFKIVSDIIHYKPIIAWIPSKRIKRQLIMMIGDLCSTIETKLEAVK